MIIAQIIIYLNIFFWLLPPLRQYKGGYFYFFLLLGISDPVNVLLNYLFKIHPHYTHLFFSFLAFTAVLAYKKKLKPVIFLLLVPLLIFFTSGVREATIGMLIFHLAIFYNFLDMAVRDLFNSQSINFYFIMLIFYEITIILKVSALILNVTTGIYFFYITTAFGILIAVYFIFYNIEKSPKIKLVID